MRPWTNDIYRRPYSQRNIFHSEHRCKCIEELTKCGPFPLPSKFLQLGKVCRSRSGKSRYPCGHRSRGGRRWGRGRCKTRSTSWHSRGQNRDRTRSDAWLGRRSGSTQVRISWFDYESYSTKELRTKGEDKGTDGRWQWPLIGRDDFFKKGKGRARQTEWNKLWPWMNALRGHTSTERTRRVFRGVKLLWPWFLFLETLKAIR